MKRLLLLLLLVGCASGQSIRDYSTLHVNNRSGAVVQILADDGRPYRLGRAYPGTSCMKLRLLSSNSIKFGIQHQAQNEAWQFGTFVNGIYLGWSLDINQPSNALTDVNSIIVAAQC